MSQVARPRLILSGLRGGSGKTVVTLGLIGGWRARGLRVAPFKKGPDYIDSAWLTLAAGRDCHNLDAFLMARADVTASFTSHSDQADLALIEGNRGLYDGADSFGTYSTAELAKLLGAPVVLVADCTKSTRTVAAMVLGCRALDPDLQFAGVILNQVASSRQEKVVRQAIERDVGVPVYGAVPRRADLALLERHLGLIPPAEQPDGRTMLDAVRDNVCANIDLDALHAVARGTSPISQPTRRLYGERYPEAKGLRVGVVRDSAFQFYYPENLEALASLGIELVNVSAIHDRTLCDVDALYIGGGFPETHASLLAGNETFRRSVREAVEGGLPVYAECGGLIYLSESLRVDGRTWPMVGVFPVEFASDSRPQGHGYEVVRVDADNPWYARGESLTGHEFRYCRIVGGRDDPSVRSALAVERGFGLDGERDGLTYKNVWACFCHVHAISAPQWVAAMVRQAATYRLDGGAGQERRHPLQSNVSVGRIESPSA